MDNPIPIFFTIDNNYAPLMYVTLRSLIINLNKNRSIMVKVLHENLSSKNIKTIKKLEQSNVSIEFVNVSHYVDKIRDKIYTRDYYTGTTYYRLFLAEMYPQLEKAIYLDSDMIVNEDISKLFDIDIGKNLVGAVTDEAVYSAVEFRNYVEKVVGVRTVKNYFNAGMLVLNMDELRNINFQDKFLYLMQHYKYEVAQDQDYLNRICKGRVYYYDMTWNKMPIPNEKITVDDIKIVHFNMIYKPWHIDDVIYEELFWKYAKGTPYYGDICRMKEDYSSEDLYKAIQSQDALVALAQKEADIVGDDRVNNTDYTVRSKDREEILEKIKEFEKEGKFDMDVENDPETIPLKLEDVDYLKKKIKSKAKTYVANKIGERFLNSIIRSNRLIIKDIIGLENLESTQGTGAVITCNHFNPFDAFAMEYTFRNSELKKTKRLYKVIREGNYTNFPGMYGFFFKNCYTLPLSSSNVVMSEFMKSCDIILRRGDLILVYPEQSLWWNYRKPKPYKSGAFRIASRNDVPVVPMFITMNDSNIIGEDGFPIQEYTINIGEPIYPESHLNEKENAEKMMEENFEFCRKTYESTYGIKLTYTTDKDKLPKMKYFQELLESEK